MKINDCVMRARVITEAVKNQLSMHTEIKSAVRDIYKTKVNHGQLGR